MSVLLSHVFVVRHAVAEEVSPTGDDFSRRLTTKGRRRFVKLVRRLMRCGLDVELVATSPLFRTRETAEILAAELPSRPTVAVVEALAPGTDWHTLVEWTVAQNVARVAWVGHAPCVGRLVAASIGDASASVRMDKGAVASIAFADGIGSPGDLEWLAVTDMARRR